VRTAATQEILLTTGQKLQFQGASEVHVQRPDHLRSNRVGDVSDVEFYYDGATMTLYGKKLNYYATRDAPKTLDELLDHIRARLDMEPPGADLLYSDVYDGLMNGVMQAFYVGPAVVRGAKAHHLAFRSPEVDWQIWIEDGAHPLPLKYLITSIKDTGAPEFGVELSDWSTAAKHDAATFRFRPPEGATKIDFREVAAPSETPR
jgi:hypothetical protein